MDGKAFGPVLREMRQAARLSQEALARHASCSKSYLGALERGERSAPSEPFVQALDAALRAGGKLTSAFSASSTPAVPETHPLERYLEAVGWRPADLAGKLNAVLAQRAHSDLRVAPEDPSRWLRGAVPRSPVPDMVVLLLSGALGEPLDFGRVWPAHTPRSLLWTPLPADHGMHDVEWDQAGMLRLLEVWAGSMVTRRSFTVVSGAALTQPARQWLDRPSPHLLGMTRETGKVSAAVAQAVEDTVTCAQRLDDQQGGGAAFTFVTSQFTAVSRMLRRDSYDAAVGRRLLASLARFAQTAGFMAHEAECDGEAQRWYLVGLRAAHTAGDRPFAASILALMSNQAALLGKVRESFQLADAADEAARDTHPSVQALVTARRTLAHAGAGDHSGLQRARDSSMTTLQEAASAGRQAPAWAYYVTASALDAITGRSLMTLARHMPHRGEHILKDSEGLLRPGALSQSRQRPALRNSAWLGMAHLGAHNLDEAVSVGWRAVDLLPSVHSARCTGLVRELRDGLVPHSHRNPDVGGLVRALDEQLATG